MDSRYPPNWQKLSTLTKQITLRQCCNCWVRKAKIAHHTAYPWYWLQWPLVCLFPLCRRCHGIAHRKNNYRISRKGRRHDRNYYGFYLALLTKTILLILTEWALLGWIAWMIVRILLKV